MKKLLTILTVSTSILIFSFVYLAFKEKDVSDSYGIFGLNEKPHIDLELEGNLNDFDYEKYVDIMYQINNENDVTILMRSLEYTLNFDYYLLSSSRLDELFYFSTLEKAMNDPDQMIHLSTDKGKEDHDETIRFINRDINFNIYSFNHVNAENWINSVRIYSEDYEVLDAIEVMLAETFEAYNPVFPDYNQTLFDYELEIKNNVLYTLMLSIIMLLVVLLFFISASFKTISIYKLNGYSGVVIFKKLLLKTGLVSFAMSLVVNAILFMLYIGYISSSTLNFISTFLTYFMYLILILVLISAVFIIMVRQLKIASMLKGMNLNQIFATLVYVVKFVAVSILVPLISIRIMPIGDAVRDIMIQRGNLPILNDTQRIYGYSNLNRHLEYIFPEFSEETNNPEYIRHIELLKAYQAEGAYYMQNTIYDDFEGLVFPYLETDINYLNHNFGLEAFKDNVLQLMGTYDTVVLLDTSLSDKNVKLDYMGSVIDPKIGSLEIEMPKQIFSNYPSRYKAVVIHALSVDRMDKTSFNDIFFTGFKTSEIEAIASQHGFGDLFQIEPVDGSVIISTQTIELRNQLVYTISTWIVVFIVAYAFYTTYFKAQKKKINIMKLHGYSFLNRYKDFIFESLFCYIPLLIGVFIVSRDILKETIYIIGLTECLIYFIVYIKSKWENLPTELKKEII